MRHFRWSIGGVQNRDGEAGEEGEGGKCFLLGQIVLTIHKQAEIQQCSTQVPAAVIAAAIATSIETIAAALISTVITAVISAVIAAVGASVI